jgi:cytidylate kinase
MVNGAEELPAMGSGKTRKFQQLVELQSELVKQARKNELAEQRCDALRRELESHAQQVRRKGRAATWMARLARLRELLVANLRSRSDPGRR